MKCNRKYNTVLSFQNQVQLYDSWENYGKYYWSHVLINEGARRLNGKRPISCLWWKPENGILRFWTVKLKVLRYRSQNVYLTNVSPAYLNALSNTTVEQPRIKLENVVSQIVPTDWSYHAGTFSILKWRIFRNFWQAPSKL